MKRRPNASISHRSYMDDLKLYARSPDQLQSMSTLVKSFSDTICMEFGFDKCEVIHAKKGKVQDPENGPEIMGDTIIQDLGVEDNYKYLGLQQLLGIADTTARKLVEKKVMYRIEKFVSLSSMQETRSLQLTPAIPVAAYTFGVVKWPDTALQAFDRKIRTTLIKH
jgi:hypothetical protein